jgi:hypothetical protein
VDPLHELGYLIWQWLVGVSGQPGFFTGVLIGALGLALVALVVFRVQVWWGEVKAPFRPQTVTHKTDKTPAQVVGGSCSSLVRGLLVFAFVICVAIEILRPGTLLEILQALVP